MTLVVSVVLFRHYVLGALESWKQIPLPCVTMSQVWEVCGKRPSERSFSFRQQVLDVDVVAGGGDGGECFRQSCACYLIYAPVIAVWRGGGVSYQ